MTQQTANLTQQTIRDLSRRGSEPAWLLERRLAAWRAFEAMAMPDPLEEEWRRTDISGFDLEAALKPAIPAAGASLPSEFTNRDGLEGLLVQQDGVTSDHFLGASASQGVLFTDLQSAATSRTDLVEAHLHTIVRPEEWKLLALEAASWQGGALIYVPRGVEVELPLRYAIAASGASLFPHLLVIAEEGSAVSIIQDTFSPGGDAQALVSGVVEIVARPNARIRFTEVQRWGGSTYNFSTIRARLESGAELTAALIGLGARLTKTKLEAYLDGEGSRAELVGVSYGEGQQHFDYNTLQEHIARRTSSDLLFKAALTDSASEVWYGTVRIGKGASESDANQTSRNLLLSDHAKAAPIPVLEIEAYDILRCSHGATAGPIDEEQLFYLESRGIPHDEAERLLVEAFFQPALERVPVESLREQIAEALARKIEAGR
jgi:Fe-S cluster assembly protein SufD